MNFNANITIDKDDPIGNGNYLQAINVSSCKSVDMITLQQGDHIVEMSAMQVMLLRKTLVEILD